MCLTAPGASLSVHFKSSYRTNLLCSLATLGLGAALLSERLNGVGVVRQLELSFSGMDPLLMCIIGALLVATFKPPERRTESGASAIYSVQDAVGRLSFLVN